MCLLMKRATQSLAIVPTVCYIIQYAQISTDDCQRLARRSILLMALIAMTFS